MPTRRSTSAATTILQTGLIAGTLDIATAIMLSLLLGKATAVQILQGIASGVFGREAFSGGWPMALSGLVFHYIIAMAFTAGYFLVYPYLPLLRKQKIISGLLFGLFVWVIMNLVVLPLSNVQQGPLHWAPALRGMVVLMLMIGLPVSLRTHKYYAVPVHHT